MSGKEWPRAAPRYHHPLFSRFLRIPIWRS
jgi:hypothetical protein